MTIFNCFNNVLFYSEDLVDFDLYSSDHMDSENGLISNQWVSLWTLTGNFVTGLGIVANNILTAGRGGGGTNNWGHVENTKNNIIGEVFK